MDLLDPHKLLDSIGWKILEELQEDARISNAELGRRVGLSTPAAAERVRKMEEAGIITGYYASVNPAKVGLPMLAYIRMQIAGTEKATIARVIEAIRQMDEVQELHCTTGSDSFIIKAQLLGIEHLDEMIERLTSYGMTSTNIVLSTPLKRKIVRHHHVENHQPMR